MPELIVTLKGRELHRSPITRPVFNIGRDPSNDVVIDNPSVSRLHATVAVEGGVFVIRDKDSANGFYVGGTRRRAHVLRHDDEVQIGKFVVRFDASSGPSAEEVEAAADESSTLLMQAFADNPHATTHLSAIDVEKALKASRVDEADQRRQQARQQEMERQIRTLRRRIERWKLVAIGTGILATILAIALVWVIAMS